MHGCVVAAGDAWCSATKNCYSVSEPDTCPSALSHANVVREIQVADCPWCSKLKNESDKRKKLFEQEFFKQLRIWGSGDTIINRGLITDRTQDLMIRPSNHNGFQYLKKTWLRKTSGVDIASLYTQLACLYANESKIIITK